MKQLRPGDRFLRGHQVRLIDQNNQQVGIVSFESAMAQAQAAGLDLVLVPTRTEPQVTRIMDFGKWQFDEAKRAREQRRSQIQPKVKEIKLHANIDDNDFNIKCRHASEFLTHGDSVRLILAFRGREMAHQEIGMEVMNRFIGQLSEISTVDGGVKRMGKIVNVMLKVKPQCRIDKKASAAPKAAEKNADTAAGSDTAAPAAE